MSVQPLRTRDNWIILRDARFSPDEVLEEALRYQLAKDAADEDFNHQRLDHHERFSAPARERAGYELETITAPRIRWQEAEALARRLLECARDAAAADAAQGVRGGW